MPRYLLTLEYDGGPFAGFQAQAGVPSVQTRLEEAVRAFSGEAARIHVAGRTDAGVHATGQAAHFDVEKAWPEKVVRDAINAHLVPDPIAVLEAREVDPDLHARFSATGRRYLYRALDRRAPAALERARVYWVRTPLDVEAMNQAAEVLVGHHDFTTFRDAQCQAASPLRTLRHASVERRGSEIAFVFEAQSFLHRQVRSMVGSLILVGAGRWTEADLRAALEARDRRRCGPTAPAHGLYLTDVAFAAVPAPGRPADGVVPSGD